MKKNIQKIKYYACALLGFFVFIHFLYFRFIRERLPRDIPFTLSELGFFVICVLCILYGLTIIRIWFPRKQPSIIFPILYPFLEFISTPFRALDDVVKTNKYVSSFYPNILRILPDNLRFYKTVDDSLRVYIMIYIFPRFFLLFIFALDIFYFKQLHYIYMFAFIPFFFFLYRYVYFSIEETLDNITRDFDEKYLVRIISRDTPETTVISDDKPYVSEDLYYTPVESLEWHFILTKSEEKYLLRVSYFIFLQSLAIENDHKLYEYECRARDHIIDQYFEAYYEEYFHKMVKPGDYIAPYYYFVTKLASESEEAKEFNSIPFLIYMKLFLDNFKFTLREDTDTKKLLTLINLGYLICWLYLLSVSFKMELLTTFLSISDHMDPFCGTFL